jgi:hypothetical protein
MRSWTRIVVALLVISIASCTAPTSRSAVDVPAPIARYYTIAEMTGLREKFDEIDAALATDCTADERDDLKVWMAFMGVALEAGDDPERTAEVEADTALKAAAEDAKTARDRLSDGCNQAVKAATWGFL